MYKRQTFFNTGILALSLNPVSTTVISDFASAVAVAPATGADAAAVADTPQASSSFLDSSNASTTVSLPSCSTKGSNLYVSVLFIFILVSVYLYCLLLYLSQMY